VSRSDVNEKAIVAAILWAWLCFMTRSFILNGPFVIAGIILYAYYLERLHQIELQRQIKADKEKAEADAKNKTLDEGTFPTVKLTVSIEEHKKHAKETAGILGSGLHFVGSMVDRGVSLGTKALSGALGVGQSYLGLPQMIQSMDKKVLGLNDSLNGVNDKLSYIDLTKEERRFPVAAGLVGGWVVWRIINHFLPFRWIAFVLGEAIIFAGSGLFQGNFKGLSGKTA
jgi:hypothetical protein